MTVRRTATAVASGWDEAFIAPGVPRAGYGAIVAALNAADLPALSADVARRLAARGATFGSEPFGVCPVPRAIAADEWTRLADGLAQRVRALSAFVADAYGPRAIVAAGVLPERVIEEADGDEPALRGRLPAGPAPIGVAGLDVVRDEHGELRVLEDNLRTPSGIAYAVAARAAVTAALRAALPAPAWDALPRPVELEEAAASALRAVMSDAAAAIRPNGAGGEARVVVLTDGPGSSAYFEHATVARWLGAPLVTLAQLERRGEELWHGGRRVEVVYRRCDEDRLQDDDGAPTALAALLLEPWLAGRLALVNGFGTGVADDKLAHAYVEEMIRFYLGEEPRLRSVATLDLADAAARERVLDDLGRHVVKPRHGQGGDGVVICAHAEAADLRRIAGELRRPGAGARWIAQRTVALSSHPTVAGDRLEPRHVDLRPFVLGTRDGARVVPGGLTRVAWDRGALVVNSSQDGGAKDTWVLR